MNLHLTLPHLIETPERPDLARELHGLSMTFRRVLSHHYLLDERLEGAIDFLDAFLTEVVDSSDEICEVHHVDEDASPRCRVMFAAAAELDRTLNKQMTFRRRFLYYQHIISRYERNPAPKGSGAQRWRSAHIRFLNQRILEIRAEYDIITSGFPQAHATHDPFAMYVKSPPDVFVDGSA